MEESRTYRWVNLRVDSEFFVRLKNAADANFLPVATYARQILGNELRTIEKNINPE